MAPEICGITFDRPWRQRVQILSRNIIFEPWNFVVNRPIKAVTSTILLWIHPPKLPIVVHSADPSKVLPPAPLPLTRKRRLSIEEATEEPQTTFERFQTKIIGTSHSRPFTSSQEECRFLQMLPSEIRVEIYRLVLGDQTLHIIPSIVPSLTPPPRFTLRPPPFHSRLDHAPCRYPIISLVPEQRLTLWDQSMLCDAHGICAAWIAGSGELYFQSSATTYSQTQKDLETRYRRWWMRKNGIISLLKTCRIVYSETIPILYATNAFSFINSTTFGQFRESILPQRVQMLRSLNLQFRIQGRVPARSKAQLPDEIHWARACRLLDGLTALRNLHIVLEDHRFGKHLPSLLEPLTGVKVRDGGDFAVHVHWDQTKWEKDFENRGLRFRIVRDA